MDDENETLKEFAKALGSKGGKAAKGKPYAKIRAKKAVAIREAKRKLQKNDP